MDAPVGCARPRRNHCPGIYRQAINPIAGGDRLSRYRVGAKGCPVTFALIVLIGDGPLHHENERALGGTFSRLLKRTHKVVAVFVSKKRVVKANLWNPG